MTDVVGVRFKRAGQIYHFDPGDLELEVGDKVVVETARGLALGRIVVGRKEAPPGGVGEPLKAVLRRAQPDDLERAEELKEKEHTALKKCEELVAKSQLAMKPLAAEYNLDGSHLTIFFKSEKRVDFRSLLRELSSALKTRVELRQVGARDAAKLVGGLGRCGGPLCCASHLTKFETISMKMAREQDLPLNPANISGVCGRLLCCLSYENEQYRAMKKRLPAPGKSISTGLGEGKVIVSNPLKETVVVQLESEAVVELSFSEIEAVAHDKPQ
jgi:cell fate regulator YaaT (PSP1 superfamily)